MIPGGGAYADLVRAEQVRMGFSDAAAHWMGIIAMHQSGLVMLDLCPSLFPCKTLDEARNIMLKGKTCIWMPGPEELRNAPVIKENWNYTSDSIALWACHRISPISQLLLVKSCELPSDKRTISIKCAQHYDWIDAGFSNVWTEYNHTVWMTLMDKMPDWSFASTHPSDAFHLLSPV